MNTVSAVTPLPFTVCSYVSAVVPNIHGDLCLLFTVFIISMSNASLSIVSSWCGTKITSITKKAGWFALVKHKDHICHQEN